MTAEKMYRAARLAATDLEGVSGAYVHLGCDVPVDVLRELAQMFGGQTKRTVYAARGSPYVIESLRSVRVGGVDIEAQGRDEVRPGDDVKRAFRSGDDSYVDVSAEAAR